MGSSESKESKESKEHKEEKKEKWPPRRKARGDDIEIEKKMTRVYNGNTCKKGLKDDIVYVWVCRINPVDLVYKSVSFAIYCDGCRWPPDDSPDFSNHVHELGQIVFTLHGVDQGVPFDGKRGKLNVSFKHLTCLAHDIIKDSSMMICLHFAQSKWVYSANTINIFASVKDAKSYKPEYGDISKGSIFVFENFKSGGSNGVDIEINDWYSWVKTYNYKGFIPISIEWISKEHISTQKKFDIMTKTALACGVKDPSPANYFYRHYSLLSQKSYKEYRDRCFSNNHTKPIVHLLYEITDPLEPLSVFLEEEETSLEGVPHFSDSLPESLALSLPDRLPRDSEFMSSIITPVTAPITHVASITPSHDVHVVNNVNVPQPVATLDTSSIMSERSASLLLPMLDQLKISSTQSTLLSNASSYARVSTTVSPRFYMTAGEEKRN